MITGSPRYLGLDLGGTNIKAAVLDDCDILVRESYPAEAALGPEHVRNRLADLAVTGNAGCAEALTSAAAFSALGGQPTPEHVYAAARAGDGRARGCRRARRAVARDRRSQRLRAARAGRLCGRRRCGGGR